jgi:hypothetical protein
VYAREGYMSEESTRVAQPAERKIDRQEFTALQSNDVPIDMNLALQPSEAGPAVLKVTFHVDISKLRFVESLGVEPGS